MSATLHAFPDDMAAASALAEALALPCHTIRRRHFPDGESLVRVHTESGRPILFRRLNQPNGKLFDLLLAADALAQATGACPVLVAPYLPYMRQDAAFHPGEAISQKVFGRLLSEAVSRVVTVDPHLHRTAALDQVFPGLQTVTATAAPLLGALVPKGSLVVGPDAESAPLARDVAIVAGCDWTVMHKVRQGDHAVEAGLDYDGPLAQRNVVLVDDICSSGATLANASRLLLTAGARSVEALVVHALHDEAAALLMRRSGLARLRSTDSLDHRTNAVPLAPLLAEALRGVLR